MRGFAAFFGFDQFFKFLGGGGPSGDALLLEDGDYILFENDDFILLE